jgi:hypothetical protein
MKLQNNSIGTLSQGFESKDISVVSVNADALEIVSQMFQNDIYSNKLEAAIRETTANAIDEHIKYNIDRDVEINLETVKNETWLSVRDFAKGLDEKDLREEPLADNLELVNDNAIDHIARANEELNILNELREKGETENIVLAWRARNYATLISDGVRAGITSVFDITDVTIGTHKIQDAIENPENYTVVFARIHY